MRPFDFVSAAETAAGTATVSELPPPLSSSSSSTAEATGSIAGIPKATVARAATAALGAGAAKAKTLADYEEREVQRLVHTVVETQLKKLELKLQQFEELEAVLESERRELERQRHQLYLDRLAMKRTMLQIQEQVAQRGGPAGAAAAGLTPQQIQQMAVVGGNGIVGGGGDAMAFVEQQMQMEAVGPLSQEQGQGFNIMSLRNGGHFLIEYRSRDLA